MKINTRIPTTWKHSTSPRKQRKWRAGAPLHTRNALMAAPLVKSLREKIQTRNLPVRKGDKVKVLRGQFKGKIGAVTKVNPKQYRLFIEGIELVRKNGAKVPYGIHPSKVMILEMHEDKKRIKQFEKKWKEETGEKKGVEDKKAETPKVKKEKTQKVEKNG